MPCIGTNSIPGKCDCAEIAMQAGANRDVVEQYERECPFRQKPIERIPVDDRAKQHFIQWVESIEVKEYKLRLKEAVTKFSKKYIITAKDVIDIINNTK